MAMWGAVEAKKRKYLWLWIAIVGAIYLSIGVQATSVVQRERAASARSHEARMAPGKAAQGDEPGVRAAAKNDAIPVTIGMYFDGIDNFSIRDSLWTSTFFIWFRWTGRRDLDPGKHFQLVDAKIEKKELVDEYHGADGVHYQRYRVTARAAKFFNTTRVPLDDHMLNIYVEDGARDATKLRYVADDASNISSRVRVSGYNVTGFQKVVKDHAYKSSYGDPRAEGSRVFSQFIVGIGIKRSDMGLYFKIFIGLFAGMLLTFTSLAIRASEGGPRVSMPVGAYFGAVANSYLATSMLPSSGQFGLVEYVSFLGMFTIFLCLLATVVSMYVWNVAGDKEFSRAFDRATLVTIGLAYLVINLVLPYSAYGTF